MMKNVILLSLCEGIYMEEKLNAVGNLEAAFTSTGYTNWKQASLRFGCHEATVPSSHNVNKNIIEK